MKSAKIIVLITFYIMTSMMSHAQESRHSIEVPSGVPKEFFDPSNYKSSEKLENVFSPHLWISLSGDYDRNKTSIGAWRFGCRFIFEAENKFRILSIVGKDASCGTYRFDAKSKLLYLQAEKPETSPFGKSAVCKLDYFVSKKSKARYLEALQIYRYIDATSDMSIENIKKCKTEIIFDALVRSEGVYDFVEFK